MGKLKHTPGPWEILKDTRDHSHFIKGNEIRIARNIQGEANAHLIATAPELLEMLEKCSSLINDGMEDRFDEIWPDIKEVIKKARGEK